MLLPAIGILMLVGTLPILWWALAGERPEQNPDATPRGGTDLHQAMLQIKAAPRLIVPSVEGLGQVIRRLTPIGMVDKLEQKIIQAGLQGRWNVSSAIAIKGLATIAGTGLGIYFALKMGGIRGLGAFGICTFLGFTIVDTMIGKRAQARQLEMEQKLPDVLDQMSVCVEAGLGFDAALQRASASCGGPLAEELGRTIQDIRIGSTRTEALQNLLDRTAVPDLRMFSRALIQAERTGVPIAKVLRTQSEDARERRRQRAEERAMKLPVKLIFPLILCILPSLFVVVLGPAILNIIQSGGFSGKA